MMKLAVVLVVAAVALSDARPQGGAPAADEKPMPYEFEWKVDDAESKNNYGQNEVGNEAGRVEGKYYVLLADGRTMTVEYYVDGDSGFVPKISFSR
ncbi:Pro-resilin [Frankliniella fusca]|uniref:Pro-resilin n=1 Tax=Frankliniella fusca TaxID=407009 RepID=A0AAE1GXN0_9NEOP|nr:Pro-resilin [Frankliniella fusca]